MRRVWLVLTAYILLFSFSTNSFASLLSEGKFNEAAASLAAIQIREKLEQLKNQKILVKDVLATIQEPKAKQTLETWLKKDKIPLVEQVRIKNFTQDGKRFVITLASSYILRIDTARVGEGFIKVNDQELMLQQTSQEAYLQSLRAILEGQQSASHINLFPFVSEANAELTLLGWALVALIAFVFLAPPVAKRADVAVNGPLTVARFLNELTDTCQRESAQVRADYANSKTARIVAEMQRANLVGQQGTILPSGDCATFARRVANAESKVTQLGDAQQACQSADAFITCANRFESTTQKVKAADGGASGAAGAGRAGE